MNRILTAGLDELREVAPQILKLGVAKRLEPS